MKKYLTLTPVKCFLLVCLFVIAGSKAIAQDTPLIKYKPYMWVEKKEGLNRVARFNAIKFGKISRKLPVPQTNSFNLENFLGMISYFDTQYPDFKYLHVYIGVGDELSAPDVFKDRLVLIFSPASEDATRTDKGYFILPEYFDPKNADKFKITRDQKDAWINRYVSVMTPDSLDRNDTYNYYPSNLDPQIFSDTRHVTYCKGNLNQLIQTKNVYSTIYDLSNSMNGYLGMYPAAGIEYNGQMHYKNRTILLFVFTDNQGREFYLETIGGFNDLQQASSECPHGTVDKGLLCPTHCP